MTLLFNLVMEGSKKPEVSARLYPSMAATDSSFAPEALKILLAEDNRVNQQVALLMLRRLGLQADVVEDGEAVLSAFEAIAYDLVLMDIQMPRMDGIEACRQLREKLEPSRAPWVIAVTANALQDNRRNALSAGMNGFLTKPLHLSELKEHIQACCMGLASLRGHA